MHLSLLECLAALALVVTSSVNAHEGTDMHASASAEQSVSASRLRGSERVREYFGFLIMRHARQDIY